MDIQTNYVLRGRTYAQFIDCTKLDRYCVQTPIHINYTRIKEPSSDVEFPYFCGFIQFGVANKWNLISTKMSEKYEPLLIDDIITIIENNDVKLNFKESILISSANDILVMLVSEGTADSDNTLSKAWIIINSYNGSGSTAVFSGFKNLDSGFFMPKNSKSIAIRHNKIDDHMKKSIASITKGGHPESMLNQTISFINNMKNKTVPSNDLTLMEMGIRPENKGESLYDTYINRVITYMNNSYTPKVLLDKVSILEKEFSRI